MILCLQLFASAPGGNCQWDRGIPDRPGGGRICRESPLTTKCKYNSYRGVWPYMAIPPYLPPSGGQDGRQAPFMGSRSRNAAASLGAGCRPLQPFMGASAEAGPWRSHFLRSHRGGLRPPLWGSVITKTAFLSKVLTFSILMC